MGRSPNTEAELARRLCSPEAVLDHITDGTDVIVGTANGAPDTVLDAIEAGADRFHDVRLHQMLPLRKRPYICGEVPGLRHVSWFLSDCDRQAFADRCCDLVPNNFSDVPKLLRRTARRPLAVASACPPDAHGYFSLGCHADYMAALAGDVPLFLEANRAMPRTFGENQVHVSQVLGWSEADYPLVELPSPPSGPPDRRIAELVAERIPDGATLQVGIGAIPGAALGLLHDRSHLGINSELITDAVVDLVESGAVTGSRKRSNRNKVVTTSALGTRRLYDFVDENPGVEFWPVDYTNDAYRVAQEDRFVAINATLEVDFLGQCASESLGSHYFSSSGGQPDFARGAIYSPEGQSFIVLHSSTHECTVSRIVPRLQAGAAVTTFKNIVDKVVTEHGVAELRGSTIGERARRLIAVADPAFRDDLTREARGMGYL
ncbi:MAG TPA: acetyl-CoA hydrolase/transferase C-terminal domain-containing protein [Acidimicrobiales bacterium]|nr:acetyl-CoA hydrolase/transferase C-terminal domain-containing protein [Acidimicrobiales bacterium]